MPAWPVRRGALLGGVLALAACAAAILLPLRVCLWLLGGLFFGGILSLLLSGSRRTVPLFCCLAAALFLAAGLWQRTTRADPVEALAGGEDTLCGQVIACPRSGRYYTVAVTAAGQVPAGTRLLLYCPDIAAPALYEEITAAVRLCALPSALAYQRANGVFLTAMPTGYGEQAITITGQTGRPPLRDRLRPLRLRLTKQLRQLLPGDEGGLLAAMCLGERSGLDTAATADFRRCGLSHLLAVSGLHLSAIAGGIWLLLGTLRLRPQIAAAATLLCSGLFAWLVGFTPSVSRAFCTACVLLSGQFFRRQADGLNSLGLALTLLLVIDPYTLYDVGFWLSFGATAGILTVTPALQRQWLPRGAILHRSRWLRLRRAVLSSLSVTLGATLPTLPLLVWLYREVAWLSPLTNLLLVPLAGVLLFLGCGGLLLSALPLAGGLAHPLLLAAGGAARILLWCAALPGRLHTGTLGVNTTWLAVWITAAATVTTVLLIRKKQRTLAPPAAPAGGNTGGAVPDRPPSADRPHRGTGTDRPGDRAGDRKRRPQRGAGAAGGRSAAGSVLPAGHAAGGGRGQRRHHRGRRRTACRRQWRTYSRPGHSGLALRPAADPRHGGRPAGNPVAGLHPGRTARRQLDPAGAGQPPDPRHAENRRR